MPYAYQYDFTFVGLLPPELEYLRAPLQVQAGEAWNTVCMSYGASFSKVQGSNLGTLEHLHAYSRSIDIDFSVAT